MVWLVRCLGGNPEFENMLVGEAENRVAGHCQPTVAHEQAVVRLQDQSAGQALGAAGLDVGGGEIPAGTEIVGHESGG